MSQALIALLLGVYMLPSLILSVGTSVIYRYLSERQVVSIGFFLMIIGGLCFSFATNDVCLFSGRLLSGCGAIIINTATSRMVADRFRGNNLNFSMSIFAISWPLGLGADLVIFTPLIDQFGWRTASITPLIFAFACWMGVTSLTSKAHTSPNRIVWLAGNELRLVVISGVIWGLTNVAYILIVGFAPEYLVQSGFSKIQSSNIISILIWLSCLFIPLGGILTKTGYNKTTIMIVSLFGWAVSSVMLVHFQSPIIPLILIAFFASLPSGIILSLPAESVRNASNPIVMGTFFSVSHLGMALFPMLGGLSIDVSDNRAAPLFIAAAYILLAAVLYLLVFSKRNKI